MNKRTKTIFLIASGLVGLLVVAAAAMIIIRTNQNVKQASLEAESFVAARQSQVEALKEAAENLSKAQSEQAALLEAYENVNALEESLSSAVSALTEAGASEAYGVTEAAKKTSAENETAVFFGKATDPEIARINEMTLSDPAAGLNDMLDLKQFTLKDVYDRISAYSLPEVPFYEQTPVNDVMKQDLLALRNLGSLEERITSEGEDAEAKIEYGILIHQTSVRSFPTEFRATENGDGSGFDYFQESLFPACSGVLILHHSFDGAYAFALGPDYSGWIREENIAYCVDPESGEPAYELFKAYLSPEHFVVSLIHRDGSDIFRLGEIIPYSEKTESGYVLILPSRDEAGRLVLNNVPFPRNENDPEASACFSDGFLNRDPEQLIKLGEMMLDVPYGWGDTGGFYDCSSFVGGLYRCFGYILPRNTGQMKACGAAVDVSGMSKEEKMNLMKAHAAAVLVMPGHAMLYAGSEDIPNRIIHDSSGAYVLSESGESVFASYGRVVASDITSLYRADGTSFFDNIHTLVLFDSTENIVITGE